MQLDDIVECNKVKKWGWRGCESRRWLVHANAGGWEIELTKMRLNPHVSSHFMRICRRLCFDVEALCFLLCFCCPWKDGFEHAGSANVSIAAPALDLTALSTIYASFLDLVIDIP